MLRYHFVFCRFGRSVVPAHVDLASYLVYSSTDNHNILNLTSTFRLSVFKLSLKSSIAAGKKRECLEVALSGWGESRLSAFGIFEAGIMQEFFRGDTLFEIQSNINK